MSNFLNKIESCLHNVDCRQSHCITNIHGKIESIVIVCLMCGLAQAIQ